MERTEGSAIQDHMQKPLDYNVAVFLQQGGSVQPSHTSVGIRCDQRQVHTSTAGTVMGPWAPAGHPLGTPWIFLDQCLSTLKVHYSHLERLGNTDLWTPPSRDSGVIGVKDGLGIGVFTTSPR